MDYLFMLQVVENYNNLVLQKSVEDELLYGVDEEDC
jgi:hypothetical protein